MDPHLFSFALLPLLPSSLLILDCLCPLSPPILSLALTSSPLLLSIRGPLYLSSPNVVFIVAVFSGHVVVCPCIASSLLRRSPGTYQRAFYFFSRVDPFAFARALCFAAIYYAPRSFLCIGARVHRLPSSLASQFFINDSLPFPSLDQTLVLRSVLLSRYRTFLISHLCIFSRYNKQLILYEYFTENIIIHFDTFLFTIYILLETLRTYSYS